VRRRLDEAPRVLVAVQAVRGSVRLIERDLLRDLAEVVDPDVARPFSLAFTSPNNA
jgi:hypothetical protein